MFKVLITTVYEDTVSTVVVSFDDAHGADLATNAVNFQEKPPLYTQTAIFLNKEKSYGGAPAE